MITEDYVSFEIAKLLKDKEFDVPCRSNYRSNYKDYKVPFYHNAPKNFNGKEYEGLSSEWFSAPTLQMAMKWLREVHDLCIEPYRTACGYLYTISSIPYGSCKCNPNEGGDDEDSGQWTTYEGACEVAIKYCLENLI